MGEGSCGLVAAQVAVLARWERVGTIGALRARGDRVFGCLCYVGMLPEQKDGASIMRYFVACEYVE